MILLSALIDQFETDFLSHYQKQVLPRQLNEVATLNRTHKLDKSKGIRCDQSTMLTGINSATDYPQALRRIKYYDAETSKTFNFPTTLPFQRRL